MKYELKILIGAILLVLVGIASLYCAYLSRRTVQLLEVIGFIAMFLGAMMIVKTLFVVLREGLKRVEELALYGAYAS